MAKKRNTEVIKLVTICDRFVQSSEIERMIIELRG